jgi:sporulation protein YlmC with PRC-barrel domain
MRLELGAEVRTSDNAVRELDDVVIDSASKSVTHLVVELEAKSREARLVPVGLIERGQAGVNLRCTAAELEKMDAAREFAVLGPGEVPEEDAGWEVGVEDIVVAPSPGAGLGEPIGGGLDSDVAITYDRVPKGEVELRHASSVYSADGHHVGRVDGVGVDESAYKITELLLDRGHLWWRREIAIPIDSVEKIETDTVTLGIPKSALRALPASSARGDST